MSQTPRPTPPPPPIAAAVYLPTTAPLPADPTPAARRWCADVAEAESLGHAALVLRYAHALAALRTVWRSRSRRIAAAAPRVITDPAELDRDTLAGIGVSTPDPIEDRDALAELILPIDWGGGSANRIADAVIAAGWRPPARVITTAAERDALPAGCMVKQLTTGTIYRRTEDITTVPRLGMCAEIRRSPGDWYDANGNCCFDLDLPSYPTIDLPLEVLYVPTEESR